MTSPLTAELRGEARKAASHATSTASTIRPMLLVSGPWGSSVSFVRVRHAVGETVRLRGGVPKRSVPAEVIEALERAICPHYGIEHPAISPGRS
jgi:hypothetical protein